LGPQCHSKAVVLSHRPTFTDAKATLIQETPMLKLHSAGPAVTALTEDLRALGYYSGAPTSTFNPEVAKSVRAMQMQTVDIAGRPLVVDGIVGPVTQWALDRRRGRVGELEQAPAIEKLALPPAAGPQIGLAALKVAIAEMDAGHGEIGGDNRGPHVRRYLNDLAPEGKDWCAGFVSFCFRETGLPMPFKYSVGARDIRNQMRSAGHEVTPTPIDPPRPGDIIVWWRTSPTGWQGHVGIVHSCSGGLLRTIEGNRTPKVGSFVYTLGSIQRLLGFVRAP
jgi:hypothetical protein